MRSAQRYPFIAGDSALGEASLQPVLPITLIYGERSVAATGLLDTGAMINVLPYRLGLELGAVWEEQSTPLQLTGNLARYQARVLFLPLAVTLRRSTARHFILVFGRRQTRLISCV